MRSSKRKAIVIGAGIGGLTAAIALRRAGLDVALYERARELRAAGTALSVMSNAVAALREIGVSGALEERGQVIERFFFRTAEGRVITEVPLKRMGEAVGAPSTCIHRAALQEALLSALGDTPIVLGARCTGFETSSRGVRVSFDDGSEASGDVLIGADGFNSAVRRTLVGEEEVARRAGYVCWLATTPYAHPRLSPGYVGHYWGRGTRFGLIDIGHGHVYWWGTKNVQRAGEGLDATKEDIARVFAGWADEVEHAIDVTPASAIVRVEAKDRPPLARWGRGRVTLLGDAAHPMLTSLGQGACMAIEDAVVLARCLGGTADVEGALRAYERARQPRARSVARLARAVAHVEQWEARLACLLRDAYFRFLPGGALVAQNMPLLTFEGAPVSNRLAL